MEKVICVFGASITWGACDEEKGGWINRLRLHLESFSNKIMIYNLGIPGETTDDLLKRFKNEAGVRLLDESESKEYKDHNIIILSIGTNDSSTDSKNSPRISPEKFQKNLNKLFNQS